MLRLVIIIVFAYLLYRLFKGLLGQKKEAPRKKPVGVIDEMVQDPFCKTYIPRREAYRRVLGGEEILFCSKECADKFEEQAEGKIEE